MAIFNLFPKKIITNGVKSFIVGVEDSVNYIKEALSGKVWTEKIQFNEDLGEEHPFDFMMIEQLGKRFGLVNAIIDKYVDTIMSGGINITSEDNRAKQIIEDWMKDVGFDSVIRAWLREAIGKGNGFMELGSDKKGSIDAVGVLNANFMYVKRDDNGKVEKYTQYLKDFRKFSIVDKDAIEDFQPKQIAHLKFNVYGDCAYGIGTISPAFEIINDLIGSRKELHTIMRRKANAPLFMIGGDKSKDDYPSEKEIKDMKEKLTYLNNKNEWAISDLWKPQVVDFGNFGSKFEYVIDNDMETLFMACQIPSVLMGKAKVPEGLAESQKETWMYHIQSMREETEKIVEENIFKVVLNANGIDEHVEIVWGLPSQKEKMEKVTKITELLKNPFLNDALKAGLELELADIFGIPEDDVMSAEEERQKEEEKELQPVVPNQRAKQPSQNPPQKQPTQKPISPKEHLFHEEQYTPKQIMEFDSMTVQEWVGFNYSEFTNKIIDFLRGYNFSDLKGTTKTDFKAGLLRTPEIEKLRNVLTEGFEKNQSIRDIQKNINNSIELKNRLRMKDGNIVISKSGQPILSVPAAKRAIMIARTETVRAAAQGSLKNYKDGGIEKVRWISALSERTCPICNDLNGQIYPVNNTPPMPAHVMCRCFADSQIPIYTSKGFKQIGKIKIGDLVLSHNGKFRDVTKIIRTPKYKDDLITIKVEYENWKNKPREYKLTTTPEHPYLTKKGWKKASELKNTDDLIMLGNKCKECNKIYPIFTNENSNFCSLICANKYTAKKQFEDPKQHKIRSIKTIKQMKVRYNNWTQKQKNKIVEKAHIKTREMWKKGIHPLKKYTEENGIWNKGLTKKIDKRIKRQSEKIKGSNNPVHRMTKESKKRRKEKMKNFYIKHPEKHPNIIMAQKGFVSKPQKELFATIKMLDNKAVMEYPVITKNGIKFIDVAIPDKKIGFEYDGAYWHQDEEKDKIREKAILDEGWILLRFNEKHLEEGFKEAYRVLKNHNKEYVFATCKIKDKNVWKPKKAKTLYNISVAKDESYIAKGFVTHNCTFAPVVE